MAMGGRAGTSPDGREVIRPPGAVQISIAAYRMYLKIP